MRRCVLVLLGLVAACANGSPAEVDATGGGDDVSPTDAGTDGAPCNGVDYPCDGVYVRTTGNDGNAGTRDQPKKTIAAGIAKAMMSNPPAAVLVGAGVYAESVMMRDGVSVYGGFDTGWTRNGDVTT